MSLNKNELLGTRFSYIGRVGNFSILIILVYVHVKTVIPVSYKLNYLV